MRLHTVMRHCTNRYSRLVGLHVRLQRCWTKWNVELDQYRWTFEWSDHRPWYLAEAVSSSAWRSMIWIDGMHATDDQFQRWHQVLQTWNRRIVKAELGLTNYVTRRKQENTKTPKIMIKQHRKIYEMTYHYSQKHHLTDRIPSNPTSSHPISSSHNLFPSSSIRLFT
jgi:hypothetical protein